MEHQRHMYCLWMSNYFTMYSYKIVGVAVLAFAYCSGYHCYSYYLSNYKLGVHMYCLWPPHYYMLGVHMYCLWPPHYYKLGTPTLPNNSLYCIPTLLLFGSFSVHPEDHWVVGSQKKVMSQKEVIYKFLIFNF